MGKLYQIPPDIHEKEKIIGGIFTLTQFIFIVIAAVVGIGLGMILYGMTASFIAMIIGIAIGALPFIPFGFVKIRKMGDIELFQYLKYKIQYKMSIKEYKNINENYRGGNN